MAKNVSQRKHLQKTAAVRKCRKNLPKPATNLLQSWLHMHRYKPFPKSSEKTLLAQETGLTMTQISNWFINARRRILKRMHEADRTQSRNNLPAPMERPQPEPAVGPTCPVSNAPATENPSPPAMLVVPVVVLCPVSSPAQTYAGSEATGPPEAPATESGCANYFDCGSDVGHTASTSLAGIPQAGPSGSVSPQEASFPQWPFSELYKLGLVCGYELETLEREKKYLNA